ncbi:MAG TPA: hypothetical protein PK124_00615 [Bacteroidales bacterium]|nr:hypothetical protein [Bacteroidales bacterium]
MIILLNLSYFSSCKKKNYNHFSGTIYNLSSNHGVEGAKVILEASKIVSGSLNNTFHKIAETQTDAEGKYLIEIEQELYIKFRIKVEKDGYHSYYDEFEPSEQIAEYNNDYPLAQVSFLKIKLKNNPPSYSDDLVKIKTEGINALCLACCDENFILFEGKDVDTEYFCNTVGGDTVRVSFITTISGSTNFSTRTYYCTPGEVVEDYFYY